jgi:hypothetical protein
MDLEDLKVYKKLFRLHIDACDLTHKWYHYHLFMAKLKGYIMEKVYSEIRCRYKECIRMLNGLEQNIGAESSGARTPLAVR